MLYEYRLRGPYGRIRVWGTQETLKLDVVVREGKWVGMCHIKWSQKVSTYPGFPQNRDFEPYDANC
jgi:hypothetical protein